MTLFSKHMSLPIGDSCIPIYPNRDKNTSRRLNPHKTAGSDDFSACMLNEYSADIAQVLTGSFNSYFAQATMTDHLINSCMRMWLPMERDRGTIRRIIFQFL